MNVRELLEQVEMDGQREIEIKFHVDGFDLEINGNLDIVGDDEDENEEPYYRLS